MATNIDKLAAIATSIREGCLALTAEVGSGSELPKSWMSP